MDLIIFIVFLVLSLSLILLGFYRFEHMELVLLGFFFMFILSTTVMAGSIESKTLSSTNTSYTYDNSSHINFTIQNKIYQYENIGLNQTIKHLFGLWMMVVAIIGFGGTLFAMKKQNWMQGGF